MLYRIGQGHGFVRIAAERTPEATRARIFESIPPERLRYIVLVGDVESVPTFHVEAKVNINFGSEPTIATDNPYCDVDGDGVPELAVGRLSADSPGDVKRLVAKILAYETSLDFGHWRRRINFIAGVGGFNALADMALEAATKTILCES